MVDVGKDADLGSSVQATVFGAWAWADISDALCLLLQLHQLVGGNGRHGGRQALAAPGAGVGVFRVGLDAAARWCKIAGRVYRVWCCCRGGARDSVRWVSRVGFAKVSE